MEEFSRTEMLLGADKMKQLQEKTVAVFGIGGVGGYVCEALVRSGIGHFMLMDHDTVSLSNINRQIIATHATVGRKKVDVMKERMMDINPLVEVDARDCFFLPDTEDGLDFSTYDYVVDAVDTVTAKLEIVRRAQDAGVPVISCMGTGNKQNPQAFEITDIYKTKVCPLAKVMRKELKKRGITQLKVLYSQEEPMVPTPVKEEELQGRRQTPGSFSFVPSVAGLLIAGEVVKDLRG